MNTPRIRHRSHRAGFFIAIAMNLVGLSAAFAAALTVNVKESGAIGDGVADDTAALQGALNGGQRTVLISAGIYKISAALKVDSQTTIQADPQAVIRLADQAGNDVGLFVLTNRDFTAGNRDITVEGGIRDGNNEHNARGSKEQIPCSTGVAISFINVRHLTLRNPDSYAIRALRFGSSAYRGHIGTPADGVRIRPASRYRGDMP